jgi:nitrogen fixation-related uncharacterized protein
MKRIDEYVNGIYAHVDGKEAEELKEEMKLHLLEAVEELKAEGKSEEEAVSIALERFGDEKQITKGLFSLFKTHNNLIKNLFRISMISLVLSIVILLGLFWTEQNSKNKYQRLEQIVSSISEMMVDGEISDEKNNKILSLVKESKDVAYFGLYKNPNPSKPLPLEKEAWDMVIQHGNAIVKESPDYSLIRKKDVDEAWFFEVSFKKPISLDNLYFIPFSLFIVCVILGFTSLFLKINSNRKILTLLLKE